LLKYLADLGLELITPGSLVRVLPPQLKAHHTQPGQ
jgi:hypothetical protein